MAQNFPSLLLPSKPGEEPPVQVNNAKKLAIGNFIKKIT
jgi:hypothetical protein